MQNGNSRIIKFDKDWNYIKNLRITSVTFMISLVDNNVKRIFVSAQNSLSEIDENFDLAKTVFVIGLNYGLYFNSNTNQLLVASGTYAIINVFDLNLTLIGNITVPFSNNYILEYNGILYVSSTSSEMMLLQNQTYLHSFKTLCSQIRTFSIDQNGVLAINCYDNYIYLYNSTGNYTGQSWNSPTYNPFSISFDAIGNLIISNYYGLYIFNSLVQMPVNSNTFTTCDYCIIKGKVLKLRNDFKLKLFI